VVLTTCNNVSFQAIEIDSQRRPGMLIDNCEGLRAESLNLQGAFDTYAAPVAPMITIVDGIGFKLRDVAIQTFGQVGLSVRGFAPRATSSSTASRSGPASRRSSRSCRRSPAWTSRTASTCG
jgi:hypothetical protein